MGFHFMDNETYSQIAINVDDVGAAADYLTEGMTALLPMYNDRPISVDLPTSVELKVTTAEPGVKGDRVSGATKPITLETGLVIQAPLFVDEGDVVKVDTRTGEYMTRVT
jgi:elongation factor P